MKASKHTIKGIVVYVSDQRRPEDLYSTDPVAVRALLKVETFEGLIWEPACGKGAISELLKSEGMEVISSDLFDWGYGKTGIDFLGTNRVVPNIITNPPYKIANQFIEKSYQSASHKIALLLQLTYLQGVARHRLWKRMRPNRIWVFVKRLGFWIPSAGKIRRGIPYAWFIWDKHADSDHTDLDWLEL